MTRLFKNFNLSEAEGNLDKLPEETMNDIQKNIRDGAKDLEQKWANALELVHKAYEVSNVQRPTPLMDEAWKQYEENITYAVEQLAKSRGMESDWRMSAAIFHEAAMLKRFRIKVEFPDSDPKESIVEAPDVDTAVQIVQSHLEDDAQTQEFNTLVEDDGRGKKLTFWLHGIRKNFTVTITPTTKSAV